MSTLYRCRVLTPTSPDALLYLDDALVEVDGEGRFVGAVLRPAKRPSGAEIRPHLRRLPKAIRRSDRAALALRAPGVRHRQSLWERMERNRRIEGQGVALSA